MGTHNRAVHEHFFKIHLRKLGKNLLPDTAPRPAGEALIDAVPAPEVRRQIPPGANFVLGAPLV